MAEAETKTTHFVIDNNPVEIVLKVTDYVSFTGTFNGGTGQIVMDLAPALAAIERGAYLDEALEICAAWNALHLKQTANLTDDEREQLNSTRLAMTLVSGERYGAVGDLEDIGEANFSNADDAINSLDVIKRIEELESAFEAAGLDWEKLLPDSADYDDQGLGDDSDAEGYAIELKALKVLTDEGANYAPDWRYGETLIRETHFAEYVEELVSEIGDMPKEIPGYIVIDWEATANNDKLEYAEVYFSGVAYLIR
jgi:hypothetical protein